MPTPRRRRRPPRNGWQTAIDLSTIARFDRFYGDFPVKNFDGNNSIDYYRQIPLQNRLQYREAAFTPPFNEGTKQLYLTGTVNPGTPWIDHIKDSPDIENSTSWVSEAASRPALLQPACREMAEKREQERERQRQHREYLAATSATA